MGRRHSHGLSMALGKDRINLRQIWVKDTDRAGILNTLAGRYDKDWAGTSDDATDDKALVQASDADSIAKWGVLEGTEFAFDYVRAEAQGQDLIDWKKEDLAFPRLQIEFIGSFYFIDTERGDILDFDFTAGDILDQSLLELVTPIIDKFRVIDMQRRFDGIQITIIKI